MNKSKLIKDILLNCESYIERYEPKDTFVPSCKNEMLEILKNRLKKAPDIRALDTKDMRKTSMMLFCDTAFALLASGKYHYWRGCLSEQNCGPNMLKVYLAVMDLAVKLGYNDEESKNETVEYLHECIAEVG